MALPRYIRFEGLDRPGERIRAAPYCFYTKGEFRAPKAGEWFISGAEPTAYRAKNDLTSAYQIVVPTRFAVPAKSLVPGEFVRL